MLLINRYTPYYPLVAAHLEKFPGDQEVFKVVNEFISECLSLEDDVLIVGGFCRRLIAGEELAKGDIDILLGMRDSPDQPDIYQKLDGHFLPYADNEYENDVNSAKVNGIKIDIMSASNRKYVGYAIRDYDFTICRTFTDGKYIYSLDDRDIEDIKSKVLRPANEIGRLLPSRIKKFVELGYKPSPELVREIALSAKGNGRIYRKSDKNSGGITKTRMYRAQLPRGAVWERQVGGVFAADAPEVAPVRPVDPELARRPMDVINWADNPFIADLQQAPEPAQPAEMHPVAAAELNHLAQEQAAARDVQRREHEIYAMQLLYEAEAQHRQAVRPQAQENFFRRVQAEAGNIRGPQRNNRG